MNEVKFDLMLEILKDLQSGQKDMRVQIHEIKHEIQSLRGNMNAMQYGH